MFKNDTNYLDQHFLIDKDIIKLFIDTCDINKNDLVVEIGPGKGTISNILKTKTDNLILIEKDKRLSTYLKDFNVIYESVLNIDIPRCNKIVTSLPYSITEPFIYKLIDTDFDKLIMICGSSFANNNTKLGILTNLFFKKEIIKEIKPSSFDPEPKVLSSLITLEKKDINELSYNEIILRNLYLYRYMKVKNALKEIYIKLDNITQRIARDKVNKLNIDDIILNKLFDELSNEEVLILKEKLN